MSLTTSFATSFPILFIDILTVSVLSTPFSLFCIKVDSREKLDEIIAKFKAANYTILYEPATNGGNEVRAITFEDNILEVCC